MFEVSDQIKQEIQRGMEDEGKITYLDKKIEGQKPSTLPSLAIYDTGFSFEKTGIGEAMGVSMEETEEEFNGDGVTTKFKFKTSALKPLKSVEVPIGNKLREPGEYTVNYSRNEITFRSAPPKAQRGKSNILVAYSMAKSSGEIKGIRLKIYYNFDVWAKTQTQCDKLALGVVRTLLFSEDILATKGIHLTPLGGNTISSQPGVEMSKDLFARRLIYRAEADVRFINKLSRIEKIEIGNI